MTPQSPLSRLRVLVAALDDYVSVDGETFLRAVRREAVFDLIDRIDRIEAESAEPEGEDWAAIGKPARTSADATAWLPRCRKCGVPRGTLRHALLCTSGVCDDPDAAPKSTEIANSLCGAPIVGTVKCENIEPCPLHVPKSAQSASDVRECLCFAGKTTVIGHPCHCPPGDHGNACRLTTRPALEAKSAPDAEKYAKNAEMRRKGDFE